MKNKIVKFKKIECPICKGMGRLKAPFRHKKEWTKLRGEMVKALIKNGYSYRQVAKFVGLKSVRSISIILKKK